MPTTLRPNRPALALPLTLTLTLARFLPLPVALPLLALFHSACADSNRLVRDHQSPLRNDSLEPWQGHRIDGEPFDLYALRRTLVIFDGVDAADPRRGDDGAFAFVDLTANGRPAEPRGFGSGVALTTDGYILTCAHCVEEPIFLVLGPDRRGGVQQAPGRIVWNGRDHSPPVDVALIHAPLTLTPAPWADAPDALPGADLLTVGVGFHTSRLAAGIITGGPTSNTEPDPGEFHAYLTNTPNIHGDSGGPALLRSGSLLGICTLIELVRANSGPTFTTTITRPNPAWINQLIKHDRATSPPPPPARSGSQ
ncbi:MAG: trypsin-like peptidase domain-containing protein [Phycisphaeraceae bacterium]|nr:trypsin-like peptidase domain-containing protein [Phycisphaeraceae bacterium]